MVEENKDQEFRLKNIDETRSYFIEKINQNELMSKKFKKVCTVLVCNQHLLILVSTFSWCFRRYCKFYSRNKNLCINCSN